MMKLMSRRLDELFSLQIPEYKSRLLVLPVNAQYEDFNAYYSSLSPFSI